MADLIDREAALGLCAPSRHATPSERTTMRGIADGLRALPAALEAQIVDLTAERDKWKSRAEALNDVDLCQAAQAPCQWALTLIERAEKAEAENAELRKASAKSLLETGRDLLVELAEMQARAEKAEADRQTFETACLNAVADRRETTDELLREREARQKAEAEVERLREAGTALASYSQLAVNCGWLEDFEELTAWFAAMKGEDNGLSD